MILDGPNGGGGENEQRATESEGGGHISRQW